MAPGSPQEIFDESEVSDCGSMVVEPATSTRAPSPVLSPPPPAAPATRSLSPDFGTGPDAKTPAPALGFGDQAANKPSAPESGIPDGGSHPENKTSGANYDQEDETRTDMSLVVPTPKQQAGSVFPRPPVRPFLFDFDMPYLAASPEEIPSSQKRSRDDFEVDLGTVLDTDLFGDQGLSLWGTIGEFGDVSHESVSVGGNFEAGAGVSTVAETDHPKEGDDGEEEREHEGRSPRAPLCKRRGV